jgi:outer membrane protein TolC
MKLINNCIWLTLLSSGFVHAAPLTLKDYLQQVQQANLGLQAANKKSQGLELRSNEGSLIYSPVFLSEASRTVDKRETAVPTFSGVRTESTNYMIGFKEQTPWGLAAKINYDVKHVVVAGSSLSPDNYYMAGPSIEASFALWRNLFGSETRAQATATSLSNKAIAQATAYQEKVLLFAAEQAYWRLALAKEALRIQLNVLSRAEKLQQWATRRASLQLGERSDMLQARAAVDVRKIDLQSAQEEERTAILYFNQSLNRPIETAVEDVTLPDLATLKQLTVGPAASERLDLAAARSQATASYAIAQLAKEKAKPTLELFGFYSRNGKDALYPTSFDESWTSKYPVSTVGLRLAVPLAFGVVYDMHKGTGLEQEAANLEFEKKQSEVATDWSDVLSRFKQAQERLDLANQVEQTQSEKLEAEKERLLRGRTTTYQILVFEQDYAQARLFRLRTQAELLRTYAQLKLFGDSSW